MSQFTFNIALGREVEFYNRVNDSDPTNAVFVLVVLANTGLVADSVLRQYDTLAAVLAGASNEATNTDYARIVLDDTDLAAYTVDDTLNRIPLELPTQTFVGVDAGDSWRKLLVCYDPDSTGGTDSAIIPVTAQDMLIDGSAVIPNGNDIVCAWPDGWLYAS